LAKLVELGFAEFVPSQSRAAGTDKSKFEHQLNSYCYFFELTLAKTKNVCYNAEYKYWMSVRIS